jgi:hypothetical protein
MWLPILATVVVGCTAPLSVGPRDAAPVTFRTTLPATTGDPPIPALSVALIDRMASVTSFEASPPVDSPNPVDVVPGRANAIRVTWLGGECDAGTTLTMRRIEILVEIHIHSDPTLVGMFGCSAVGIRRQVVIGLNTFIPSAQFKLVRDP